MKRLLCIILSLIFVFICFNVGGFAAGATVKSITPADPSGKSLTLAVNQSRRIFVSVSPKSEENNVAWSVADKTVAVVSANGTVTGKKTGKTTVTVTAKDSGKKRLSYKVTVTARKSGNSLSTDSCTVVKMQDIKYPYGQLCKDILSLKEKYPYIFDYVSLGKSYDNRSIFEIILGNRNSKNKILVQASVHAREYINTVLVMKQVETLCANYYSGTYRGKYYSELLDNCCFYIIPMVNPDGASISMFGADGIRDRTLRSKVVKMCDKYGGGKSSYYTRWKANARGVDLNRNWDCNWDEKKTVTHACSDGYKGSCAESEKETRILKKAVETLQPKAVISYHSNGSYIYWDFLQTGTLQRKCRDLFDVASGLTGYYSADNPSAYYGADSSKLSPCFGDWVAGVKKTPTLTIETGRVDCPIPASSFPTIWGENKHILPAVAYFVLNDTAINISSLSAQSRGFTLTAKKVDAKNLTYQIAYSDDEDFTETEYVQMPSDGGSLKISALKANKDYYVCIRTVKKYGTTRIYGRWSDVKTVRTKR